MTGLHHFIRGEKENPAVVLVHGLLGSSRNLMRLQEKIADLGFYTIAYDQRGHGHSPHFESDNYSLEELGADLWTLLDELKVEKAHLIGHSMGGRVCMLASTLRPDQTLSLSMLDVAPRVSESAISALHDIIDPLPHSFVSKDEAKKFLAKSIVLPEKAKTMFEQFLLSNLRAHEEEIRWMFDLDGIRKILLPAIRIDQFPAWKKLTSPLLIVRGEKSEHFSESELEYMLEMNPSARSAIVQNAGHWIHVDNLEGTFEILKDFLKGLS